MPLRRPLSLESVFRDDANADRGALFLTDLSSLS
jgi:hypothetical protein